MRPKNAKREKIIDRFKVPHSPSQKLLLPKLRRNLRGVEVMSVPGKGSCREERKSFLKGKREKQKYSNYSGGA